MVPASSSVIGQGHCRIKGFFSPSFLVFFSCFQCVCHNDQVQFLLHKQGVEVDDEADQSSSAHTGQKHTNNGTMWKHTGGRDSLWLVRGVAGLLLRLTPDLPCFLFCFFHYTELVLLF